MSGASPEERGHPVPVMILAVTAISAAAVLVRLAPEVHPIGAGFWRTLLVGGLLLPVALLRRPPGTPPWRLLDRLARRDLLVILGAAALLAGHFWSWFASLHMTTVLRSTVLVCLNPIWAGVFEWVFLRRNPGGRFWLGIGVAVAGVVLMTTSGSSPELDGATAAARPLLGDALALLGGLLGALYLLAGRVVRPRVDIDLYGAVMCLACALWLLPAAALTGATLTGFSWQTWAVLAALGMGPQLMGHIGLNYAVRYLPAATVAAVTLLEPAGAAALGAAVLGELPEPREVLGAAVAVLGVGLATLRRRSG